MWDGEWNAGGGVHDESADTWMNLVTGKLATISRGTASGLTWDTAKKCAVFDTTTILDADSSDVSQILSLTNNLSQQYEVHCVYRVFGDTAANGVRIFGHMYGIGLQVNYYANSYGYNSSNPRIHGANPFVKSSDLNHITPVYAWYDGSTVNAVDYLYGSTKSVSNGTIADSSGFSLGGTNGTPCSSPVELYAVRIYNRALTTTERSGVYAVDAERFGIS